MAKILICDDEPGLRKVIARYAEHEGYEYVQASDGSMAVEFCRQENFDLIIMDVMMPLMDGITAVEKIRAFSDTPVIMLTARGEEYDKVMAFESGVDDYVVKPFSSKELMMRVSAILRRTAGRDSEPIHKTFTAQGLICDFTARSVTIDGKIANMTPKEIDLLFYLVRNRNIAVSREKILQDVWGFDYFGDDRTLDTHMKLLRKSLGVYAEKIKTLRGHGYRFDG